MTRQQQQFRPPTYSSRATNGMAMVCSSCGAAVWNTGQHTAFHGALWEALRALQEPKP